MLQFVAHSNCQHQLENTFYGNMFCIRDFEGWQRLQFFLIFTPILPVLYIIYLFVPNLKVNLSHFHLDYALIVPCHAPTLTEKEKKSF